MIFPLILALGLTAPADTAAASSGTAEPAAVIVHRQPAVPVLSLRLSLAVSDPPGYAGAGHLLQHFHDRALRDRVSAAGGRLQYERNPDAVVYTVTGPAAEAGPLTEALLSVLRPPAPSATGRLVVHRELRDERLAEWETAGAHVRTRLRHRLFPDDRPAPGTRTSAARIEDADLAALWNALYDPSRVTVVAVGDVDPEAVRAAFARLPEGRPSALPPEEDLPDETPLAEPQATRGWLGAGYPVTDADPASVSIAARLLGDRLRRLLPEGEISVDHWWTHRGQAMAAVVAVPGPRLGEARRLLDTALKDLGEELEDETVREAGLALRREMLFSSRTPDRMAALIGGFADRTGSADGANRFHGRLREIRRADVEEALREMIESEQVRIDLPPQPLER